ncbi:sugar nucleotide-binding protein [Fulvivirga lutimaris]|uniref:sugar nucleotide-binding protein n=1 Tax=Fulvivirga lutimaris TaxID=1819566 RepID=UPI0012BB7C63|nr:hypothetical protein [Fulvivirga lutimaris]
MKVSVTGANGQLESEIRFLSSEFSTRANRPKYSILDKSKIESTFNLNISRWKDGLNKYLIEIQ